MNPFNWIANLPEELKTDVERLVNNGQIEAQIAVLEIIAGGQQAVTDMLKSKIEALRAGLK